MLRHEGRSWWKPPELQAGNYPGTDVENVQTVAVALPVPIVTIVEKKCLSRSLGLKTRVFQLFFMIN